MYCLKCDKETKGDDVFCEACLVVMDRFPVKPGTPVQLPVRPAASTNKAAPRKRVISVEERLQRMKRSIKSLTLALVASLLALALTVSMLVQFVSQTREEDAIGKNYNTVDTGER